MKREFQRVTQRAFLAAVQEHGPEVDFEYPRRFLYRDKDGKGMSVTVKRTGDFLGKLGERMPFEDYDRLTRKVWLAALRNS